MNGAVHTVSRRELGLRWRSLVVIGLLAGVLGGALLAGVVIARRTDSAPDRLTAAVAPGDVRVDLFGPTMVDDLVTLPGVEVSATASLAVGHVRGPGFVYLGMLIPHEADGSLMRPVVVAGREADPAADDEAVVVEEAAEALGLQPGDTLDLDMLTAEEVGQFDTGFGEPDGPNLELTVVGLVRTPPDVVNGTPVIASPAVADRLGDASAGEVVAIELTDRPGSRADFESAAAEIGAAAAPIPGREELPPLVVTDLAAGTREARRTTQVLVVGMSVALAVGLVAAVMVLWQAFVRHHGLSTSTQQVESALGLTAHERALARMRPAVLTAIVAVAAAIPLGIAAGIVGPPGAAARLEPAPGWRGDPVAVALGAIGLGAVILAIAYATARRAGQARAHSPAVGGTAPSWTPRRHGWPLLGMTFALSSGSRDGVVPTRAALIGVAFGVAGIVATLTVDASIDRLVDTPARWGWNADVVVVDATDEVVAELAADPRVAQLTDVRSGAIDLGESSTQAYALDPIAGTLGWTIVDGRHPDGAREILVGTRAADALSLEVGDEIRAEPPGNGPPLMLDVVGIGIGPALSGERLGESVAVSTFTLVELSPVQLFREALVDATPSSEAELVEELEARYEIGVPEPPRSVGDLGEIDRLPTLLGVFLAMLGSAALFHALVVASRRRRRDLAVLNALGGTRRQVWLVVTAMAAVSGLAGVIVGIPLGVGIGRLVMGEIARGVGVAGDVALSPLILVVAAAVPAVAVILAAWPARRASRRDPAMSLRQE